MTTAAPAFPMANPGLRAFAFVVDALLLTLAFAAMSEVGLSAPLAFGMMGAYFALFWAAVGEGRTPGMRALGLRVVRTDAGTLSVPTAVVRLIMLGVACAALFIGVLWALFDARKQGWHDKVAGTYVVQASEIWGPMKVFIDILNFVRHVT